MDEALKHSSFKLVTDYFTQLASASFLPAQLPKVAAEYFKKLDEELNKMGAKEGDIVKILNLELEYRKGL